MCCVLNLAVNDENQVKIRAAGGMEAVITGMLQHADSEGVQGWGCEALLNLASNDENQVKIGAAGGMEVATVAMQKHPSSSAVQEKGSALLRLPDRAGEEPAGKEHVFLHGLQASRSLASYMATMRRARSTKSILSVLDLEGLDPCK